MALIGKHGNTLENHEKTWDHHGKTLDNHGQKLVSPKCYRSPGVSGYYHKVWIFLRLFPSFNSGITPFPCGFCQGWWHRTSSACSLLLVAAGQKKSRDGDHGLWANMVMPKPKYLCQLSSWDGQPNLLTPNMFDFFRMVNYYSLYPNGRPFPTRCFFSIYRWVAPVEQRTSLGLTIWQETNPADGLRMYLVVPNSFIWCSHAWDSDIQWFIFWPKKQVWCSRIQWTCIRPPDLIFFDFYDLMSFDVPSGYLT